VVASIKASVMVIAATFFFVFTRHHGMGWFVSVMAALTLLGGWCVPSLHRALERIGHLLVVGVGAVVNTVLLVPFYLIAIVPGRLVLALCGRDPLERAFPSRQTSFWRRRPSTPPSGHYRRQH
jgi:hypothetical protein